MAPVPHGHSEDLPKWQCKTCGCDNLEREDSPGGVAGSTQDERNVKDPYSVHRSRSRLLDTVIVADAKGVRRIAETCWNCGADKGENCPATTRVVKRQIERVGDVETRLFKLKGQHYQLQNDLEAAIAEQQVLRQTLDSFGGSAYVPIPYDVNNGKNFGVGLGPGKGLGFAEDKGKRPQRSSSAPSTPMRRQRATTPTKRVATPPKKNPMSKSHSQTSLTRRSQPSPDPQEDFGLLSRERGMLLQSWLAALENNKQLGEGNQIAFDQVAASVPPDDAYDTMKTNSVIGSPRHSGLTPRIDAAKSISRGMEQMGSRKEAIGTWSQIQGLQAARSGLENEVKQLDEWQTSMLHDFIPQFIVAKRDLDELNARRHSMRQQMLQMRKTEAQKKKQNEEEEIQLMNTFSQACAEAGLHVKYCLQRLENSLKQGTHAVANFTEFDVEAQRPLGLNLEERITVLQVDEVLTGGVMKWNEMHKDLEVMPGDQIIKINDTSGNAGRMLGELKTAKKGLPLKLRLRRYGPWPGTVEHKLQDLRDRVADLKSRQGAADSGKFLTTGQSDGTSSSSRKLFNESVFDTGQKQWGNVRKLVPFLSLKGAVTASPNASAHASSRNQTSRDGDSSDIGMETPLSSDLKSSSSHGRGNVMPRARGHGRGRGGGVHHPSQIVVTQVSGHGDPSPLHSPRSPMHSPLHSPRSPRSPWHGEERHRGGASHRARGGSHRGRGRGGHIERQDSDEDRTF